jgi:hypothetical protein
MIFFNIRRMIFLSICFISCQCGFDVPAKRVNGTDPSDFRDVGPSIIPGRFRSDEAVIIEGGIEGLLK